MRPVPKAKVPRLKPHELRELEQIAEIASYGFEFQADMVGEELPAYITGTYEATAFIVACALCQRFGLEKDGVGTAETLEALSTKRGPVRDEKKLFKRLKNYVLLLRKLEVENGRG